MPTKLCSEKWSHFLKREVMESFIENGENLMIVGPPKSGKSELVREVCQDRKYIRVNCILYNKPSNLRNQVVKEIVRFFQIQPTTITTYPTLLNYFLDSKLRKSEGLVDLFEFTVEPLYIIFENTQYIWMNSSDGLLDFFKGYQNFVQELEHYVVVRSIVISTSAFQTPYFKFFLPYPDDAKVERFIKQKVENLLGQGTREDELIRGMSASLITLIRSFNLIIKDFDSFELITEKLMHFLRQDLRRTKDPKAHLLNLKHFHHCNSAYRLFFGNLNYMYMPVKELEALIDDPQFRPGAEALTYENEKSNFGYSNSNIMEHLPIVPSYVLLACFMAAYFPPSKDSVILGLLKKTAVNARGSRKQEMEEKTEKKAFFFDRVVWIVEAISNTQNELRPINELQINYHSNEFYLCFNFFEKIKWIKEVTVSQGNPKKYKFTCDVHFVEKLITKLGFDKNEFKIKY